MRENEPTPQKEIAVTTGVTGMLKRIYSFNSNTDLQAKDIKIDAYYHGTNTAYLSNTKLHYNSSTWMFWDGSAQLHYYWPIEGSVYTGVEPSITVSSLDFVGYCPYTRPGYITADPTYNSTGVTFTCNMSSYMTNGAQSGVSEYMLAILDEQTLATQTAAGGALPLQFKHPFALIKFVIAEGSGTHVQVNSISIAGLKTSGNCVFDGSTATWSSQSGSTDMTITPENPLKYGTSYTETVNFMVIPNNYGPKTLTVNGTWDDWSAVTKDISADVDFNWQPGYIYTYNLTVTPTALIVKTDKYTEQW